MALRMVEDFDAGPHVSAAANVIARRGDEVFMRLSHLALDITRKIIEEKPEPQPQTGEPVTFARRQPQESGLPEDETLKEIKEIYEFSWLALRRGETEADMSINRTDDI